MAQAAGVRNRPIDALSGDPSEASAIG